MKYFINRIRKFCMALADSVPALIIFGLGILVGIALVTRLIKIA